MVEGGGEKDGEEVEEEEEEAGAARGVGRAERGEGGPVSSIPRCMSARPRRRGTLLREEKGGASRLPVSEVELVLIFPRCLCQQSVDEEARIRKTKKRIFRSVLRRRRKERWKTCGVLVVWILRV